MYLNSEIKKSLFARYGQRADGSDTGSPESQIALLTHRITEISRHLRENKKDFSAQRGLLRLVGQRKRLLRYLKNTDMERYRKITQELNIRG
ncbi:MAG: 30S ribosomal protein S15 [Bacteroidia bacterium]